MRISFFWVFLGAFFLINTSCARNEDKQNSKDQVLHFFDIAGYFAGEIDRLQADQPSVNKELTLNEKTETLEMDDIDFSDELSIFEKADINKVSWIEKYDVDTIQTTGAIREVVYTATDEKLKIRKIELSFDQDQLIHVKVFNEVNSPVLQAEQRMEYTPGSGYRIEQEQKVRFLPQKIMKVVVNFVEG